MKSILSAASLDDLRAEIAHRESSIEVSEPASEQISLNDFSAWLFDEAQMFRWYVEQKQGLDCEHRIAETMTFSEWLDLWFSDWQEDGEATEEEGPRAS